jgi:nucleoside phosphorylase
VIAFIAAERREFDGLLRHLKNARKLGLAVQWAVAGELNGKSVVLAANGPGPALAGSAAEAVKEQQHLGALVSYGFCGGLDPALSVNDIFVASEIFNHTWRTLSSVPRRHSCRRLGKLLSIDRVACTSTEKSELRKTGADAVEMEAAAIASRALAWNIPFYCIRVVTDTAHEEFSIDFNRVRDSDGRFSRSKIIAAAFRNPLKLFPELIKLNSRTKSAARVLGDFVATCEF